MLRRVFQRCRDRRIKRLHRQVSPYTPIIQSKLSLGHHGRAMSNMSCQRIVLELFFSVFAAVPSWPLLIRSCTSVALVWFRLYLFNLYYQTIVATALPTITAQLGGGKNYSWVGRFAERSSIDYVALAQYCFPPKAPTYLLQLVWDHCTANSQILLVGCFV